MLEITATTASRNADLKDAVHTLFTSLSTDPDPAVFMPATQRITYNRYKAAIVPTNGGVIIARKAAPGTLWSDDSLKWKPSRSELLCRIVLEHLHYPTNINDSNRMEAVRIGQAKAKLWRLIEHIRRHESLEQGKRPIRQPDRSKAWKTYAAAMTLEQERIYLRHYLVQLKAHPTPDMAEIVWVQNRMKELEANNA